MPSIWRIYHVDNCRHAIPAPKPKYIAIVCKDTDYYGFMINTRMRKWVLKSPYRISCHAKILVSQHPVLDYDSYVDCMYLYDFTSHELNNYRCDITDEVQSQAANFVPVCPRHNENERRRLMGNRPLPLPLG